MRRDFCVLILTHGRPDRQTTLKTLATHGYTGPAFLVIDDEDKRGDEYKVTFGEKVVCFSKADVARGIDVGDNNPKRNTVLFARNASFEIAARLGFRHFIQLDDDYSGFYYRFNKQGLFGTYPAKNLDRLFTALVDFHEATPFASVAISQGGDWIGGGESKRSVGFKRKAMNLFVCDTERPFRFVARMNDDVSTYTCEQRRGVLFVTAMGAQLNQAETQANPGGLTEMYLEAGTYVKSFYSVMMCPSAVKVSTLGDARIEGVGHRRIHHVVNYNACAPLVVRERHRKPNRDEANGRAQTSPAQ